MTPAYDRLNLTDRVIIVTGGGSGIGQATARLLAKNRHLRAPAACVEAVRASFELPFAEGLTRERALFDELLQGRLQSA